MMDTSKGRIYLDGEWTKSGGRSKMEAEFIYGSQGQVLLSCGFWHKDMSIDPTIVAEYILELKRDQARLDWLDNHGKTRSIVCVGYDSLRAAIDDHMKGS